MFPVVLQMECLVSVIEEENRLRSGGDLYNDDPHKETVQEADYIPNFRYDQLHPGKLRSVTLGGHYTAIILDAKPQSGPHIYLAAVFLVPRVSHSGDNFVLLSLLSLSSTTSSRYVVSIELSLCL